MDYRSLKRAAGEHEPRSVGVCDCGARASAREKEEQQKIHGGIAARARSVPLSRPTFIPSGVWQSPVLRPCSAR